MTALFALAQISSANGLLFLASVGISSGDLVSLFEMNAAHGRVRVLACHRRRPLLPACHPL